MPVTLLFEIALKATAVLVGTWGTTRLMAHASAATRHLVWTVGFVALLTLPVVTTVGPAWTVALPDVVLESPRVGGDALPTGASPVASAAAMPVGPPPAAASRPPAPATNRSTAPGRAPAGPSAPEPASPLTAAAVWPRLVVGLWAAGVVSALSKLAGGLAWVAWIRRRAVEAADPDWQAGLADASSMLALDTTVTLLMDARATVPVTWGIRRPTILLPLGAAHWSPARRRVVLLHELAHVKRRDCLVQALVSLASAMYWFNPLVFFAAAALRHEQERACDDLVIAAGTPAPEYADHLVDLAGACRVADVPGWVTLAMARPSQLEGRVLAILDDGCRRTPPTPRARMVVAAAAIAAVLPLGTMQVTAADRPAAADQAPGAAAPFEHPPAAPVSLDHVVELDFEHARHLPFDYSAALDFEEDVLPFPHQNRLQLQAGPAQAARPAPPAAPAQAGGEDVSEETRRRVADALVLALDDENVRVRQQAIDSLAAMRDLRVVPGLVRALEDPSVDVRVRAVQGLLRFDTAEAVEGLLRALKDESPQVRRRAAAGVGRLRDPAHVGTLAAALQDDDVTVREQAVAALGRIRDDAALPYLTQALSDEAPAVRRRAALGLGQLRATDAVPALIAGLQDADPDVRGHVAMALGAIGDERAIDPLMAALNDPEPVVRERAAHALGDIGRGGRRAGVWDRWDQSGWWDEFVVPALAPMPPLPPEVNLDFQELTTQMQARMREAAAALRDQEGRLRGLQKGTAAELEARAAEMMRDAEQRLRALREAEAAPEP